MLHCAVPRYSGFAVILACATVASAAQEPPPKFPESCSGFLSGRCTRLTRVWGSFESKVASVPAKVAWSPDGRAAIVESEVETGTVETVERGLLGRGRPQEGSRSRLVWQLVDLGTGETVFEHSVAPNHSFIQHVLKPGRVVYAHESGSMIVEDIWSGVQPRDLLGHRGGVLALAPSADAERLVTGSRDETARCWDLRDGRCLQVLRGHRATVHSVAMSADGRRALTGSFDETAKLWDLTDGRELRTFEGHGHLVSGVAFATDGKRALSVSWDQTVRVWDLASGTSSTASTSKRAATSPTLSRPRPRAGASWSACAPAWCSSSS